jgi:DNA modification methylase
MPTDNGPGSARIIHGNALDLPLEDNSVDLVVTSPPYFGLRSYQDAGEHYAGQIGSEATPAEFVDALIAATAEMVRVLKPSGSIWVNLGDKYAGSNGQPGGAGSSTLVGTTSHSRGMTANMRPATGAPTKSLIGVPWRYAIRCIDDLGLILRAEVIWSKPNGLPESVTDRVRRSHETWFHFTKMPRYYSAVDEIREAHAQRTFDQHKVDVRAGLGDSGSGFRGVGTEGRRERSSTPAPNPLGKLPGSVWTIATQPLTVPASLGIDHFAAFPMEWPRRIIRGWSPAGVCVACGEGRRPVVASGASFPRAAIAASRTPRDGGAKVTAERGDGATTNAVNGQDYNRWRGEHPHTLTGYACDCADTTAPTTPGVVLDPFSGTGTTALVAKVLEREGIGVDMSEDYCRLTRWRTTDPDQIASAMQVAKPAKQVEGQWDLFADFGGVA